MKRRTALAIVAPMTLTALVLVSMGSTAIAANQYGISLQPGERLVSVNGVPVNHSSTTPATMSTGSLPTSTPHPQVAGGSMTSGSDQQRAQAEANYMAQHGIKGHVGGQIGNFEGCGWSTGGMPNTCTPGTGMTLTADAIAYGRDGVYRVRAWR